MNLQKELETPQLVNNESTERIRNPQLLLSHQKRNMSNMLWSMLYELSLYLRQDENVLFVLSTKQYKKLRFLCGKKKVCEFKKYCEINVFLVESTQFNLQNIDDQFLKHSRLLFVPHIKMNGEVQGIICRRIRGERTHDLSAYIIVFRNSFRHFKFIYILKCQK